MAENSYPNLKTTRPRYLLLRLSSEKGFDGRLTLDLPRSTFHDPGEATGDEDTCSSSLDFECSPRAPLLGSLRGDFAGLDILCRRCKDS